MRVFAAALSVLAIALLTLTAIVSAIAIPGALARTEAEPDEITLLAAFLAFSFIWGATLVANSAVLFNRIKRTQLLTIANLTSLGLFAVVAISVAIEIGPADIAPGALIGEVLPLLLPPCAIAVGYWQIAKSADA
jgi:hypothetical protein